MRDPPFLFIEDLHSARFFGSLQPLPPGGGHSNLSLIRNRFVSIQLRGNFKIKFRFNGIERFQFEKLEIRSNRIESKFLDKRGQNSVAKFCRRALREGGPPALEFHLVGLGPSSQIKTTCAFVLGLVSCHGRAIGKEIKAFCVSAILCFIHSRVSAFLGTAPNVGSMSLLFFISFFCHLIYFSFFGLIG